MCCSVERRSLPDEGGQLARAGDRGDGGRLSALCGECTPAAVQPPLSTPGDLADARVLARLAASQPLSQEGLVAVVVRRLHEQPAPVRGAGLRDRALPALLVGG